MDVFCCLYWPLTHYNRRTSCDKFNVPNCGKLLKFTDAEQNVVFQYAISRANTDFGRTLTFDAVFFSSRSFPFSSNSNQQLGDNLCGFFPKIVSTKVSQVPHEWFLLLLTLVAIVCGAVPGSTLIPRCRITFLVNKSPLWLSFDTI